MNVINKNQSVPNGNEIIINKNYSYFSIYDAPLSSQALTALTLSKQTSSLLWITENISEMERLYENINTFNSDNTSVYLLRPFCHDPVIIGEHIRLLNKLKKNKKLIIITCTSALKNNLPTLENVGKALLNLNLKTEILINKLVSWLIENGYKDQIEVYSQGEFSHRGGIIDCWPAGCFHPIRIEFFDDKIESIRIFNAQTQCSLEKINEIEISAINIMQSNCMSIIDFLPSKKIIVNHPEFNLKAEVIDNNFKFFDTKLKPIGINFSPLEAEENRRKFVEGLCLNEVKNNNIFFYFETLGTKNRFNELYKDINNFEKINIRKGVIFESSINCEKNEIIISENDFYKYNNYRNYQSKNLKHYKKQERISEAADIQPGDYVVHVEYGVGKYLGIVETKSNNKNIECLCIEYANKAKIYLQITQAHLLTRYKGASKKTPKPHILGSKKWIKDRDNAESSAKDLAVILLENQAKRKTEVGYKYGDDCPLQIEFESSFPYQETDDQLNACKELKNDMQKKIPMDRLLCGDVGFGKTEVAMRCAFKAIMDNKQVAVLVPTTILAQQHFYTFTERMAPFSINIEMISRFRSKKQQNDILSNIQLGKIDLLIGTHRILSNDIKFKDLGLVVIDEEQRFGVKAKEKLKIVASQTDVITLSATPIPRTLYMGLTGVRDFSTISSAPQKRQPIETLVKTYEETELIKHVNREIKRNGQIFYLHNRVKSIYTIEKKLKKIFPNLKIAVAHGQMNENLLSSIMDKFINKSFDILICTTIIENGVDIPNCNTIIIDDADKFGLSELYQLRGRVGRSNNKAFAYFILSDKAETNSIAKERMNAIKRYSGLGSGLRLAIRDLEIRGAGNILGSKQSGHISAVGFDLYCQLLKRTIAIMKGDVPPPIIDVSIQIDFINFSPSSKDIYNGAYIPFDYIEDENIRLQLYQRLSSVCSKKEMIMIKNEIKDRFGKIPNELIRLLLISELRIKAAEKKIKTINIRNLKMIIKDKNGYIQKNNHHIVLNKQKSTPLLKEIIKIIAKIKF